MSNQSTVDTLTLEQLHRIDRAARQLYAAMEDSPILADLNEAETRAWESLAHALFSALEVER